MATTDNALLLQIATLVLPRGAYLSTSRMDLHATSFTIAAKVNLASTTTRNILLGNWGSAGNSWQLLFAVNAGGLPSISLRKDLLTNGSDPEQDLVLLTANAGVAAGAFRHIATTFDWGQDWIHPTAKLYVDGREAGSVSPTITPNSKVRNPYTLMPTRNPYLIGRKEDTSDDNSWFSGQITDLRVYCAALSAESIAALAA